MMLYYYIVTPQKGEELISKTGIANPVAVPVGDNVIVTSAVEFEGLEAKTNEEIKEYQKQFENE